MTLPLAARAIALQSGKLTGDAEQQGHRVLSDRRSPDSGGIGDGNLGGIAVPDERIDPGVRPLNPFQGRRFLPQDRRNLVPIAESEKQQAFQVLGVGTKRGRIVNADERDVGKIVGDGRDGGVPLDKHVAEFH